MTNFERIKAMSIDGLAMCLTTDQRPDIPHSPCYICKYDRLMTCIKSDGCDTDYQAKVYREWLESEVDYDND